jgi:hypothetical protein
LLPRCLTREDAAKQLGLTPTTLHGRLERARDLLRECLAKRGLTLAAAMSAAALGEGLAQAALAPTFVVSSTKAAMLLAAGQSLTQDVVANHVLALTQEVIKTMFLTKLKLGTVTVLCAGLVMAMIGGSFASLSVAQNPKPKSDRLEAVDDGPQKAESDADFIRRISQDLRAIDPTPAEIHFFVTSPDKNRRQKLIDLFIVERQPKQDVEKGREGKGPHPARVGPGPVGPSPLNPVDKTEEKGGMRPPGFGPSPLNPVDKTEEKGGMPPPGFGPSPLNPVDKTEEKGGMPPMPPPGRFVPRPGAMIGNPPAATDKTDKKGLMEVTPTSSGCFVNQDSSDPVIRMEQELIDSEDLRQVHDDWRRLWMNDQPSHLRNRR